jgi:hypothetical protein
LVLEGTNLVLQKEELLEEGRKDSQTVHKGDPSDQDVLQILDVQEQEVVFVQKEAFLGILPER